MWLLAWLCKTKIWKDGKTKQHGNGQPHSLCESEHINADLSGDDKKRLNTLSHEVKRTLPVGKHKMKMRLMKDELGGKIMKDFVSPRPKIYSYLADDDSVNKKARA